MATSWPVPWVLPSAETAFHVKDVQTSGKTPERQSVAMRGEGVLRLSFFPLIVALLSLVVGEFGVANS